MRILIIDDDVNITSSIKWLLEKQQHTVQVCQSGEEGVRWATEEPYDLVFCDVMMPGMSGIEALEAMLKVRPSLRVIMISGHADISTAVSATKKGAYDFLEKPLNPEKVLLEVRKVTDQKRVQDEMDSLKNLVNLDYQMIGSSPQMQDLRKVIERAAPSDGRILIYGENGSGKELVAREIHQRSGRKGRFVQLNCAAIPRELIESELFGHEKGAFTGAHKRKIGLIEEADGGTLMMDEIGDMALETQAKLLRVLQENEFYRVGSTTPQKFNVRIISATNKNLLTEIENGNFREDLYFRLAVIPITVPSLRERVEDIPELVDHFFKLFALKNNKRPKTLSADALQIMKKYHWPGNIRELKNTIERLIIMAPGDEIGVSDVEHVIIVKAESAKKEPEPESTVITDDRPLKDQLNEFEKILLQETFRKFDGNVTQMATALQTDRANLHKKLKKYGIK